MRHLLTALLVLSGRILFAAFEDVAADLPSPSGQTPATQAIQKPPPPPATPEPPAPPTSAPAATAPVVSPAPPASPPPVDLASLKFRREIGGFAYKSSDTSLPPVRKSIQAAMDAVLPLIRRIPPEHKIQIIGHTDASGPEEPTGDKPGNIAISRRRAEAVRDHIVSRYNLDPSRFEIIAKGSSEPKNRKNPLSAENRRVVIQFQP